MIHVVCLVPPDDVQAFAAEHGGEAVHCCTDPEEIAPDRQRESVFLIAHKDEWAVSRLVRFLRQDPGAGLQPLYVMKSFGKPLDLLVDGVVASADEARQAARGILARIAELPDPVFQPETSDYLRILALLYSRPDRQLAPHRVWLDEHAYAYALLEALLGSAHLVAARLATLCEQGHLQRRGLIDRTSHCPVCSSLQLNLVDHCPHCGGTDIEESADVQCLHCGHVTP